MKDQECYWNDYDLEILIAILTMGPVIIWSPCLIEVNGGFQSIVNKSKMLKINIMSKIGFFFIRRQQALLMSPIVITHSIMSSPASSAPSSSCQNSSWHDCESMIFPWRWKPWNTHPNGLCCLRSCASVRSTCLINFDFSYFAIVFYAAGRAYTMPSSKDLKWSNLYFNGSNTSSKPSDIYWYRAWELDFSIYTRLGHYCGVPLLSQNSSFTTRTVGYPESGVKHICCGYW